MIAAPPVHVRVRERLDLSVDALSLLGGSGDWTGRRLLDRIGAVAEALRERGVGPGDRVAVLVHREPDLVAALLGVLEAGAAYVPFDPAFPAARNRLVLEDAAPVLALAGAAIDVPEGVPVLRLREVPAEPHESARPHVPGPEDPAYLLYTSGSTGRPKGVLVPHRALSNLLASMAEEPGLDEHDTFLAVTTVAFDIAALELFLPLWTGARLALASEATAADGRLLARAIEESGATAMQATPSTWRMLLDAGWSPERRIAVLSGGEPLPPALVPPLLERATALWNLYGPTETTIWSTCARIESAETPVPIGLPIRDTRVHVLDPDLRPVADGEEGELWIGGAGVALGYPGLPDLTRERFVPDPFAGGAMYRTGDLGRRLPDGRLVCLGRADRQVKVRGFRIEPGEIEARLEEHPSVLAAAAGAREGVSGDRRLVAWVVPRPGAPPDEVLHPALREHLASLLPGYMVPQSFVTLPALPLTPNRKVDHAALPDPPRSRPASAGEPVPPATPEEALLCRAFEEVLDLRPAGAEDRFLDLGGDSLAATRLVARVLSETGREVQLRDVLSGGTPRSLAAAVAAAPAPAPPLVRLDPADPGPASSSEERLFFLWRLDPTGGAYDLRIEIHLDGDLDRTRLESALEALVLRHEPLRTTYRSVEGRVVPSRSPSARISLEAPPSTDFFDRPFDLEHGPVLRAALAIEGPRSARLFLAVHHIALDGFGLPVLARDLAALYRGERLPPVLVRPGERAAWERARSLESDLDRRARDLAGAPEVLPLPADRPRPEKRRQDGFAVAISLDAETLRRARDLARSERTTLHAALLGAFAAFLRVETGAADLPIATPVAGRSRRELEDLLGFLANTVVGRVRAGRAATFRALVREARDATFDALSAPDLPFERLVARVAPERDAGAEPLAQVSFVLEPPPPPPVDAGGVSFRIRELAPAGSPFDLSMSLHEGPDGLEGRLLARADLFDEGTALDLALRFSRLAARLFAEPDGPLPLRASRLAGPPGEVPAGTLADLLREAASKAPGRGLTTVDRAGVERRRTYAELLRDASALAAGLVEIGAAAGAPVLLHVDDLQDHLTAFWGIVLAGAVPVPVTTATAYTPGDANAARLAGAARTLGARCCLTDRSRRDAVRSLLPGVAVHAPSDLPKDGPAPSPGRGSEDLALLLLTSGSTGAPKAVRHTHRSLLSQARPFMDHVGHGDGGVVLNWLPMDHVGAVLMCHLGALATGSDQVHAPAASFSADPLLWLSWIERHRATFTWAPSFAFAEVLRALDRADVREDGRRFDLSSLRVLVNGGEAVVPRTARAFVRRLAGHGLREDALTPAWGMAEVASATLASRSFRASESRDGDAFVPVGLPCPGFELRVVGETGEDVSWGQDGRLLVRGASLMGGYEGAPAPFDEDGWFDTGDRGRVDVRGLSLTGREKDVLVVHGANHPAEVVEDAALSVPGVAPGSAVAVAVRRAGDETDRLLVLVVPDGAAAADLALRVRAEVSRRVGVRPSWVLVVRPEEIPRTAIGKVQRQVVRERFAAGALDAAIARAEALETARSAAVRRLAWVEAEPAALAPGPSESILLDLREDGPEEAATRILALLRDLAADGTARAETPKPLLVLALDGGAAGPAGGLLSAVPHEMPGLSPRLVRVAAGLSPGEIEAIVSGELRRPDPAVREVAVRDGRRFVPRLDTPAPGEGAAVAAGEVVLVTGGLGGIGRALARHLLESRRCRLLLVGRTPEDALDAERAGALRELSALGEIAYGSCDVASPGALEDAAVLAEARFGARIGWVFHAAGIAREERLDREHARDLESVLRAKAAGARAAAALVRRRPGARMVDLGSVNGFFGGFAAGAYAAGSRAGEAIAEGLRAEGIPAWHVAFTQWDEVGMSRGLRLRARAEARGFATLRPGEALRSLEACLAGGPGTYVVGLVSPEGRQDAASGPREAARGRAEEEVASIWRGVLGREEVGATESFFAAGGDSLLLARLHARLEAAAGRPIALVDLFARVTIRDQAASFFGVASEAPGEVGLALAEARAERRRARRGRGAGSFADPAPAADGT